MKKAVLILIIPAFLYFLFPGQIFAQVKLNKVLIDSAILKARLGDYESALRDANQAVVVDSTSAEAYYNRG